MKVKIRRIGNSMGVILPSGLLDIIGLKAGDEIYLEPKNDKLILILEKKTKK